MSEHPWFSTKVRLVCLIENIGATRYMDSVYLFRAEDFTKAFQRALQLGYSQEEQYANVDGKQVKWKLKEIISLDIIREDSLDGAEIYSEPVELAPGESIAFNDEFHPEKSEPTQTI